MHTNSLGVAMAISSYFLVTKRERILVLVRLEHQLVEPLAPQNAVKKSHLHNVHTSGKTVKTVAVFSAND